MNLPRLSAALCALALFSTVTFANHGPGSSGGGSSTSSGETLAPGKFELSIREDYTQFEKFSRQQAADRAATGGEFDTLRDGFITTLDISVGVIEDLQVGMSIGYFNGRNFIGADDSPDLGTGDPNGVTDMVITGKYRFYRGPIGNFAIIAGIKLPTGRQGFHLDNGERLAPSDQPGSGSVDFPVGLAFSRFLTPQVTFDASFIYTARTEHHDFKVADRIDAGVALAYRLTDSIRDFPQVSLFGELLLVHLEQDEEGGIKDPNTGSDTLYISPGVRIRLCEHAAITVAPAFPVYEDVNGNQAKVLWKMAVTLTFSY